MRRFWGSALALVVVVGCTDDFGVFDPSLYDASVPVDASAGAGGGGGSGGGGQPPVDGAAPHDGGLDAGVDTGIPSTCVDASACVTGSLPPDAGWQIVAFALDASTPCPAEFQSLGVLADPTPTVTACRCGVGCDTSGESCGANAVDGFLHQNNDCSGNPDFSGNAPAGGGCVRTDVLTGASAYSVEVKPPPVRGNVTCDAGIGGTDDFDASTDLVCAPGSNCQADLCALVSQGYVACAISEGDVPCPPGAPGSVRRLVGTGASVACSGNCTCSTLSGSCSATWAAFGQGVTDCSSNQVATGNADGTCNQNLNPNSIGSISVKVSHTPGTCKGAGTAQGDAGLTGAKTLCCAR